VPFLSLMMVELAVRYSTPAESGVQVFFSFGGLVFLGSSGLVSLLLAACDGAGESVSPMTGAFALVSLLEA